MYFSSWSSHQSEEGLFPFCVLTMDFKYCCTNDSIQALAWNNAPGIYWKLHFIHLTAVLCSEGFPVLHHTLLTELRKRIVACSRNNFHPSALNGRWKAISSVPAYHTDKPHKHQVPWWNKDRQRTVIIHTRAWIRKTPNFLKITSCQMLRDIQSEPELKNLPVPKTIAQKASAQWEHQYKYFKLTQQKKRDNFVSHFILWAWICFCEIHF